MAKEAAAGKQATARSNNRMGQMPTAQTQDVDDDDGFIEQDDVDAEGDYGD